MNGNARRINYFDNMRALAIFLIVTCHFCIFYGSSEIGWIGGFLARTENTLFFAISALLFGLVLNKKGYQAFNALFLERRVVRLFASLWPFLMFVLIAAVIVGADQPWAKVVMNYRGLGWFAKMQSLYCGHLWFITMIIFCYLSYVTLAKIALLRKVCSSRMVWSVLLILSLIIDYGVTSYSLPAGFMPVILCYFVFLFAHAHSFINHAYSLSWYLLVPLIIMSTRLSLYVE